MAAFFPPVPPPEPRQPIRLSGFSIPSSSTTTTPGSHPPHHPGVSTHGVIPPTFHPSQLNSTAIDPAILFGLGTAPGPNLWNGYSYPSATGAGGGGGTTSYASGSNSILTDTDLDIENMLASFSQQQQQQQQQRQHQPNGTSGGDHHLGHHSHLQPHHFFGHSAPAGSNGFLGATSMGYPPPQQQQHEQLRHGAGPSAAAPSNNPASTTTELQGQNFFGMNSGSTLTPTANPNDADQAHPPSSVAAIPHFAHSPPLSKTNSSSTPGPVSAADFLQDSPLNHSNHKNGGGEGVSTESSSFTSDPFAAPPPTSSASSAKRSPPSANQNNGSNNATTSTSRGREGRSLSRGSSERTGSRSRSTAVSAGVGKAPRTTSRSRSARRNSCAAGYQDRPSPNERNSSNMGTPSNSNSITNNNHNNTNASSTHASSNPVNSANKAKSSSTAAGTAATNNHNGSTTSASHGTAAIIIPSSTPSSAIPLPSPSLHYSSSMPAYPSNLGNGDPSSLPSSLSGAPAGWFAQVGMSFLPSLSSHPLGSVPEKIPERSEAGREESSDPVTGWRPTQGIVMPSSAPAATSNMRGGAIGGGSGGCLANSVNNGGSQVPGKASSKIGPGSGGEERGNGSSSSNTTGGGQGVVVTKGKKNQSQQSLEDVQEEEGDEKPSGNKADPAEKRRKRRESHNLVERRRRDNINDRIAELSSLLPEAFINAQTPCLGGGPRRSSSGSNPGGVEVGGENGASPPGLAGVGTLSLMSPPPPVGLALFGTSPTGSNMLAAAHNANAQSNATSAAAAAAAGKPNKGIVLAKSVEYIRYLLENIELQTQQIAELQRQNQDLRQGGGSGGGGNAGLMTPQFELSHQHHPEQHTLGHRSLPQQHTNHFQVPDFPRHLGRAAHSSEWAAFEDEDVGDDSNAYKGGTGVGADEEEVDEGMDES